MFPATLGMPMVRNVIPIKAALIEFPSRSNPARGTPEDSRVVINTPPRAAKSPDRVKVSHEYRATAMPEP